MCVLLLTELDDEGVIEPDTGAPQEMGDDSLEVTEEMMDQANDKRSEAMAAVSDGTFRLLIHLIHHKCYLITLYAVE